MAFCLARARDAYNNCVSQANQMLNLCLTANNCPQGVLCSIHSDYKGGSTVSAGQQLTWLMRLSPKSSNTTKHTILVT